MKGIVRSVLLVALFFSVQVSVLAQVNARVVGTVYGEGEPLNGARVTLVSSGEVTFTDQFGRYELPLEDVGTVLVEASYLSYTTDAAEVTVTNSQLDPDLMLEILQNFSLALAYETEPVLITSNRANSRTGTTYENVTREQIKRRNFGQDLPMLLNQTTSAVVTSDAGAGIGYTGIRIRGVDGTATNVTVNGVPLNDAESQGVFWVNMPDFATSVDNIQIQRGVGTSTNGSGAFGASINIKTRGYEPEAYVRIDNSFGSFQTLKNNLQVGTGLIKDHFVFDARLSRISSEGWVDRGRADLNGYFLSGAYYDDKQFFKLNAFSGQEVTYQSWFGIPEAKYRDDAEGLQNHFVNNYFPGGLYQTPEDSANLFSAGRSYNYYLYDDQVDNYRQTHYQALYGRELSDVLDLNLVLHYTKGQGFFEEYREEDPFVNYGNAFVGNEIMVNGARVATTDLVRRRWLDNDFYGLVFTLDYRPTNQLNLTFGGAGNQYDGNHFGEIIWARYAGQADKDEQYYYSRSLKTDVNTYVKGLWQPNDRLSTYLDLQVRNINYQLGNEDLTQAGVENEGQAILGEFDYTFFNPKVGLTYLTSFNSQAYLSLAVGNREPARRDLIANPDDVTAETLYDLEAGYRLRTERLQLNANAYLMYYQNQLVPTGQLNDVGAILRENVDESYRAGLEIEIGVLLGEGLTLNGNVTLSQNKIVEYTEVVYDYLSNGDVEVEETVFKGRILLSPLI